jgi:hypothetical protein
MDHLRSHLTRRQHPPFSLPITSSSFPPPMKVEMKGRSQRFLSAPSPKARWRRPDPHTHPPTHPPTIERAAAGGMGEKGMECGDNQQQSAKGEQRRRRETDFFHQQCGGRRGRGEGKEADMNHERSAPQPAYQAILVGASSVLCAGSGSRLA